MGQLQSTQSGGLRLSPVCSDEPLTCPENLSRRLYRRISNVPLTRTGGLRKPQQNARYSTQNKKASINTVSSFTSTIPDAEIETRKVWRRSQLIDPLFDLSNQGEYSGYYGEANPQGDCNDKVVIPRGPYQYGDKRRGTFYEEDDIEMKPLTRTHSGSWCSPEDYMHRPDRPLCMRERQEKILKRMSEMGQSAVAGGRDSMLLQERIDATAWQTAEIEKKRSKRMTVLVCMGY